MSTRTKNLIVIVFSQHLNFRNKKEELITFDQDVSFENETSQELSAQTVGLWGLCQLKKFLATQRIQGKRGFMMNKDVDVSLTINGHTEKYTMKSSLSIPRLERLIQKEPAKIALFFTPAPSAAKIIANKEAALQFLLGSVDKIILAPAVKAVSQNLIESRLPEENAGSDLNGAQVEEPAAAIEAVVDQQ